MQKHINKYAYKGPSPLVEVIFLESMYFHSLSFRRINKGLLSIGHGKTSLFHCLFKKVEENRKH